MGGVDILCRVIDQEFFLVSFKSRQHLSVLNPIKEAAMADYSDKYSEDGFWSKIRKVGGKVPFCRDAVAMFYCLVDPSTPPWAKALIVAALGYFIFPLDAIPDVLFPIGFTDDAAVISAALVGVRMIIKDEHWKKADDVCRGGG